VEETTKTAAGHKGSKGEERSGEGIEKEKKRRNCTGESKTKRGKNV